MIWVPPGGAAAFNQQTPAARAQMGMLRSAAKTAGSTRRRKAKRAKVAKRAKTSAKRRRKLKFGSPAWRKKYMKKK